MQGEKPREHLYVVKEIKKKKKRMQGPKWENTRNFHKSFNEILIMKTKEWSFYLICGSNN